MLKQFFSVLVYLSLTCLSTCFNSSKTHRPVVYVVVAREQKEERRVGGLEIYIIYL